MVASLVNETLYKRVKHYFYKILTHSTTLYLAWTSPFEVALLF